MHVSAFFEFCNKSLKNASAARDKKDKKCCDITPWITQDGLEC